MQYDIVEMSLRSTDNLQNLLTDYIGLLMDLLKTESTQCKINRLNDLMQRTRLFLAASLPAVEPTGTVESDVDGSYLSMRTLGPVANHSNVNCGQYANIVDNEYAGDDSDLYDNCAFSVEPLIHHTVPSMTIARAPHEPDVIVCPYAGLPGAHLSAAIYNVTHEGWLMLVERRRLFFGEALRRQYAAIVSQWLLLYAGGPTDLRPLRFIHLNGSLVASSDAKTSRTSLQTPHSNLLFSITERHSKRDYLFRTENIDDCRAWIDAIGMASVARRLPTPPLTPPPTNNAGIYEEPNACIATDDRPSLPIKSGPIRVASQRHHNGYDIPRKIKTENVHTPLVGGSVDIVRKPIVKNWFRTYVMRSSPKSDVTGTSVVSLVGVQTQPATLTTKSPKGGKVNMIISQMEANGQLPLLSKRFSVANKQGHRDNAPADSSAYYELIKTTG